MRGRAIALALTAAVAAAATAVPAGAAPDPDRKIVVFDEDARALAAFGRVTCKVSGPKGERKFKAKGRHDGWKLVVQANDFTGFHTYPIKYGIQRTNFKITPPGDGGYYSNFFFPGAQPPPFAGALTFPGRGNGKIGLGFIAAFNSAGDDDGVAVAGKAKCI